MESKRPELFSTSLTAGSRTCFFDVKVSVNGSKNLKITEARRDPGGEFEHSRVMVYEEHVDQFLRSVSRAVQSITEGGKAGTSLERIRRQCPNPYARWSDEDDRLLGATSRQGKTIVELAARFGRQPGAIESRLRKLGLVEATESGVVEHEG